MDEQEQKLLNQLDVLRSYGTRTISDVRREVAEGKLEIAEGISHPVIRDVSTGTLVKGSGRLPTTTTVVESRSSWDRAFREAGQMYFDEVFEQLIQLCQGGNFKAIEFFMNRMGGKPTDNKDIRDNASSDFARFYMEKMSGSYRSTLRQPSREELAQGITSEDIVARSREEDHKAQNKALTDMTYEELMALPEDTPMREQVLWSKAISEMNSRPLTIDTRNLNEEEKQRLHSILDAPEDVIDMPQSQEEVDSIIEQGIEHARVEQEKRQQAVSEADTVTEAEPEEEPVEATIDAELLKNYLAKGGRPIGLW